MKIKLVLAIICFSLKGFSQELIWEGDISISSNTMVSNQADFKSALINGNLYFYHTEQLNGYVYKVKYIDVFNNVESVFQIQSDTLWYVGGVHMIEMDNDNEPEFLVVGTYSFFMDHLGGHIIEAKSSAGNFQLNETLNNTYVEGTNLGNIVITSITSIGKPSKTYVYATGTPLITSYKLEKKSEKGAYPTVVNSLITIVGHVGEKVKIISVFGRLIDEIILSSENHLYDTSSLDKGSYIFTSDSFTGKFIVE